MLTVKATNAPKTERMVPEPLPNPSFLWALVAPPRSGKSTLICNIVSNKAFGYKFDLIVIVSPTAAHDDTYKTILTSPKTQTIVYSDPSKLPTIIAGLCKVQEDTFLENHVLLIIDDCLGYLNKNLEKIAAKYRHYKISMMIASQQFKFLPPVVRTCANFWTLFKTESVPEQKKWSNIFRDSTKILKKCILTRLQKNINFYF